MLLLRGGKRNRVEHLWRLSRQCSSLQPAAGELLKDYSVDEVYREYEFDGSTPEFRDLWRRIEVSKGAQVEKIVKQWRREGNPLSMGTMRDVLIKMSSRAWFLEARKLVRCLDREKNLEKSDSDELLGMDIVCRSGCWKQARSKFNSLRTANEDAYVMLLDAYGSSLKVEQVEQLFKRLKKSGTLSSTRPYTVLIRMYVRLGNFFKAGEVLKELETSGFRPDAAVCWTLVNNLKAFGTPQVVIPKVLLAMEGISIERSNRKDVLRVYGALGSRDQVYRVWKEMESRPPLTMLEYLSAIGAFGILGEVEKAEQVSSELEEKSGGMAYYHCLILSRMYATNGVVAKAEQLVERLAKHKIGFEQCGPLVDAYLKLGRLDKAVSCFNKFLDKGEDARHPRKLVAASMAKLIRGMAGRGDLASAEALIEKVPEIKDAAVYNELIYAYSCAKVAGYDLETRLRAAGVWDHARTRALLKRHRRVFPLLTL